VEEVEWRGGAQSFRMSRLIRLGVRSELIPKRTANSWDVREDDMDLTSLTSGELAKADSA
jgi:hypothetical protein